MAMQNFNILCLIHMVDDLVPDGVVNLDLIALDISHSLLNISSALSWILIFQAGLEHRGNGALDCELDVSEFFVDLVLQNFSKKQHIMIIILIIGNSFDNCVDLVYNDVFEPILLVEISV